MKKIIGLILLLSILFTTNTMAQISLGVKGGVNISSVSFSKDILSSDNVTGFHIGPMVEAIMPFVGFGFDAAILYSQKGIDAEKETLNHDYIDIPVNLKYKFGIPVIKGYVTAGPYIDFRIGGDKFWRPVADVIDQVEAKNFGAGLNFGAGIEVVRHIQLGFNYGVGLTDNYKAYKEDTEISSGKTKTWSITAAILF